MITDRDQCTASTGAATAGAIDATARSTAPAAISTHETPYRAWCAAYERWYAPGTTMQRIVLIFGAAYPTVLGIPIAYRLSRTKQRAELSRNNA
uniref:Uncharacterized protein n=1 Tax=mine drainage metagenome TaxID=410659 RepID=E6Q3C3_9ZZZZ